MVFDPHCSFAPGINLYQPGLRIRFKGELHFDGFEIVNVVRMRTTKIPVKLRAIMGDIILLRATFVYDSQQCL